jgi:hypothetical protein
MLPPMPRDAGELLAVLELLLSGYANVVLVERSLISLRSIFES